MIQPGIKKNNTDLTTSGILLLVLLIAFAFYPVQSHGQGDGLLIIDGNSVFPLGSYELPDSDDELAARAGAGFNLFACRSLEDMDRVHAVGAKCWVPLALQQGATDELKERIMSLKDHPALEIWHGPDEYVWHLTASSTHMNRFDIPTRRHWWNLEERAVQIAEEQAKKHIPLLNEGIQLVRDLDDGDRQIWFNEARRSDARIVRQFIDHIDIIGPCDYPVRTTPGGGDINRIGYGVKRWQEVGKGKPVWNVLQAFSWEELRDEDVDPLFPSFKESRYMAYTTITHGGRGILYWGSHRMQSDEYKVFQESWYSLISEISQLQPFLTAPELSEVKAHYIRSIPPGEDRHYVVGREFESGISTTARRFGRDWVVILVNEDDEVKMDVEVTGLRHLNGSRLKLLYGSEENQVVDGLMTTRMRPYEVKVFSTSLKWETDQRAGRDYVGKYGEKNSE